MAITLNSVMLGTCHYTKCEVDSLGPSGLRVSLFGDSLNFLSLLSHILLAGYTSHSTPLLYCMVV